MFKIGPKKFLLLKKLKLCAATYLIEDLIGKKRLFQLFTKKKYKKQIKKNLG